MKNKKLFVLLILSLAFNLAFLGSLGYRLWEKSRHPESRHRRASSEGGFHSERMKLSPDQKKRLDRIQEQAIEQIRMIHIALIDEKKALVQSIFNDEIDSLQIEERLHSIGNLQFNIEHAGITRILKTKEVLTPEQREQFLQIMMEKLNRAHSRFERKLENKKE